MQRDPTLKPITDAMVARLRSSSMVIDGQTPLSLFERHILNNPRVTDDQIRRFAVADVDDIADSPRAAARTLRRVPDARASVNHRFSVDLLAGMTGLDPAAISAVKPSLGLTGSAQSVFSPLWRSEVPEVQLFTAMHDATSILQSVGVEGLNRAVWGQSSTVVSAILNFPLGAQLRHFFR